VLSASLHAAGSFRDCLNGPRDSDPSRLRRRISAATAIGSSTSFSSATVYPNNHHALPWAANFNKDRWQLDIPGAFLRVCAAFGWVYDARWAAAEDWERRARELRGKQPAPTLVRSRRALDKTG